MEPTYNVRLLFVKLIPESQRRSSTIPFLLGIRFIIKREGGFCLYSCGKKDKCCSGFLLAKRWRVDCRFSRVLIKTQPDFCRSFLTCVRSPAHWTFKGCIGFPSLLTRYTGT